MLKILYREDNNTFLAAALDWGSQFLPTVAKTVRAGHPGTNNVSSSPRAPLLHPPSTSFLIRLASRVMKHLILLQMCRPSSRPLALYLCLVWFLSPRFDVSCRLSPLPSRLPA